MFIEHSGIVWVPLRTENGIYVWPIEELLARRKFTKNVAERIRRLNPNGKREGERCRGWHPKWSPRYDVLSMDIVPARKGEPVFYKHGRHKFVTRVYRMEHP